MALKTILHLSDLPNLDHVPEIYSTCFSKGLDLNRASSFRIPKFMVIGHRGHGMNILQSSDSRMKAIKENSILSFNSAAKFPLDFIEFDVQVTKDDCPVIFHDDFILTEENGTIFEKKVTELCLAEFLCYGPQKETGKEGKCLYRKTKDGKFVKWNVETDDSLCTLQDAFQKVEPSLGFNIELKFDDFAVYQQDHLLHILQVILQVYFLTEGGASIYYDVRRNSLGEAMKVCLEGGLQGIVSEIKGVFKDPGAVPKIKDSNLSLLTYGKHNNVPEAVHMQYLMGIDGVIVDFVEEISQTVDDMIKPAKEMTTEGKGESEANSKLQFSQKELSFLLKLIPELIQF
ncbi:hypothetical protein E1A91_D07G269500v1 [Gossypium mustelinum]|uniref:glycerophosphodiester phosphodiesterase n=1 Tax=Gossypium mustelinum TaxID=34275 RepID=A0A5D2UFA3_GOSMU|nr:hypothetical protein E1A91_D07G269500v1 [Gossypium mustelinum]